MKKWLTTLSVLAVIAALVGVGAYGIFTDEGEATNNTFTAGHLDLKINGQENVNMKLKANNMKPGDSYNAGCLRLKNAGSVAGKLTLMVSNPVSHENGLVGPEIADGDSPGTEVDLTGYDANGGDGELWDQIKLNIYVDTNNSGDFQWNEPVISRLPMGLDMTSYYSIDLDTNLFPANQGFDETLDAGEKVHVCVDATFFDDQSSPMSSQPQYDGMTNNQAMTDSAVFDIIVGLEQAP